MPQSIRFWNLVGFRSPPQSGQVQIQVQAPVAAAVVVAVGIGTTTAPRAVFSAVVVPVAAVSAITVAPMA